MNEVPPVFDIIEELKKTQTAQFKASDPQSSVWVSANAGTGKTHVLTKRVLRLLINGTRPEKILCLTYTRAAASEMSKRVFSELSRFISLDEISLETALSELLSRKPNKQEKERARTLFTQTIETPGGFKVQTIHAFSERLLQRFPLESGVTPGFQILDDIGAQKLKKEATEKVLETALKEPKSPLGTALSVAVSFTAEDGFEDILNEALHYQPWLENILGLTGESHQLLEENLKEIERELRGYLHVQNEIKAKELAQEIFETFSAIDWLKYADVCQKGSISDIKRAEALKKISKCMNEQELIRMLYKFFFDTNDNSRKSFSTKELQKKYPDIDQVFIALQTQFLALWKDLKATEVIEATLSLCHLAAVIMKQYQSLKERTGKLDFQDLIIKTKSLLLSGDAAQWVLYKLDSGLDHLLLDESQDTSFPQWSVIFALVQEFFSGEGASQVERSIFSVGDVKQSIYSFQGAAPDMFMRMGDKIRDLAYDAGKNFYNIDLNVSFRSTKPILETVDKVFALSDRTPGVPHDEVGLRHIPKRYDQPGSIEIWNKEYFISPKFGDPWSPHNEERIRSPISQLANRIALTIKRWLEKEDLLASAGRPIHPGDILILVRKRHPLADPLLLALKSNGIPVAGADRLHLKEHIVIQDLISLGQFLLLPEDDLALAEVLKSPIFGLDDDDLLRICCGRKGSLWKALLKNQKSDIRFSYAAELLKSWRNAADFMPPYEFWANLLEKEGIRSRMINRIGTEAAEPLDEFLNLALNYDLNAPASLTGFLEALDEEDPEIKRDTETSRDEVRIMTVHGAKGLEAPIVFLPDTCCSGIRKQGGGRLLKLEDLPNAQRKDLPPFIWPIKGSNALNQIKDVRSFWAMREKEEQERLLYVALTRARDKLIIGGFENKNGCSKQCWYNLICDMLSIEVDPTDTKKIIFQQASSPTSDTIPDYTKHPSTSNKENRALPAWFKMKVPRENTICIPITPSQMIPYVLDFEGEPSSQTPPSHQLAEAGIPSFINRARKNDAIIHDPFLRGKLTHSLLQYLPNLKSNLWKETAFKYVSEKAPELPNEDKNYIIEKTLNVLNDPNLGFIFSSESQAEVPLIASIPNPIKPEKTIRITGQIDRLSVTKKEVLLVDYKTNRVVPSSATEVAKIYLYQLAAYRLALMQIYQDRPIRAGLLWTETPKIMEISSEILEDYSKDLWTLDLDDLDNTIENFYPQ